jgi:hypothetical protein
MGKAYRILYMDSLHLSYHTLNTLLIRLLDPSQFTGFLRRKTYLSWVIEITVKP